MLVDRLRPSNGHRGDAAGTSYEDDGRKPVSSRLRNTQLSGNRGWLAIRAIREELLRG
jgi:hypothetical protein